MLSESGIATDLYRMFHVWFGGLRGGLAVGTIGLMVMISAMNGLSVAGMAIGTTIALPELLRRGYDKIMVTGRSEEHTSELQSLMRISYAVFCLKKKKKRKTINQPYNSTI